MSDTYRGRNGEGQGEGHVDEASNIQKGPGNGKIGGVSSANNSNRCKCEHHHFFVAEISFFVL